MKKISVPSRKQILTIGCLLFLFTAITLLLFGYRRDEKLFSHLTSRLFQQEMANSTLNMHYTIANPEDYGIYDYEPTLPLYDASKQLESQAETENLLSTLVSIDRSKLSTADAYTHTLLERSLSNSLQLNSFTYYEEPLSPSSGMQSQLPILLAEYSFRCKRDVEDYLSLLAQTDKYFASLLEYEQEKSAAGLLMPASSLRKVITQCDTIVTSDDLDAGTHFLQTTFAERIHPLSNSGIITSQEADEYIAQNDRLLKTVLLPAYQTLGDGLLILEDKSITLSGLAGKPQGCEYYKHLLISQTGSYRPIDDIKELLIQQLGLEQKAMKELLAQQPELLNHLHSGQHNALPYNDTATMLTDLQQRMNESFPNLQSGNHHLPAVTVKNVSKNLEKFTAPAYYLTPPVDDSDNNVIYINQKSTPSGLELYTTLAHEGYPGHLYQTVYHNRYCLDYGENKARQLLWYGGYLEGWALYVEFISYDYASALLEEQNRTMDALCAQIEKHNRSLQLCLYSILDIMIHYENASYNQIASLLSEFGISNPNSAAAIYTYIAEEPCNYLKYYLGYLEILELQKLAMTQWGESYSDYAFHCFYLDCGPSDFTSLTERLNSSSQQYGRTD